MAGQDLGGRLRGRARDGVFYGFTDPARERVSNVARSRRDLTEDERLVAGRFVGMRRRTADEDRRMAGRIRSQPHLSRRETTASADHLAPRREIESGVVVE